MRTETRRILEVDADRKVSLSRHLIFWCLAALTLFWDLYTKNTIFAELGYPGGTDGEPRALFGSGITFQYATLFNHGALWGLGGKYDWGSWLFAGLSLIAVLFIVFWLFVKKHAAVSLWLTTCLAMIMGGTLGNLYDRVGMHGCRNAEGGLEYAVRDFLHFNFWGYDYPVFNYADVFLVSGAILLAIYTLFLEVVENEESEQSKTAPQPAQSS